MMNNAEASIGADGLWASVEKPWQAVFMQGWEAFRHGSIPIGAVITDEQGNILSRGRNRLFENSTLNPKIAHAEMEAIQNLDIAQYPHVYTYTLYTSMEPCPMCMGTFVMSNLRKLKVAARDSYAGSVHFCRDDPYIASKKIQAEFKLGLLETVQLVFHTYFDLHRRQGEMNTVTELFQKDNPEAVKMAKAFYTERYLEDCAARHVPFGEVFNVIVSNVG